MCIKQIKFDSHNYKVIFDDRNICNLDSEKNLYAE